jgi:hypothetical protein
MTSKVLVIGESATRCGRPLAVRRRQRSRGLLLLRIAAATLVLASVGLGVYWLVTAPLFAIRRVETGPYRFTERDPLEEILRDALGHNIWTYRTGALCGRIASLPWIEDVHVVRRLPATLQVELLEWRPLLAVAPSKTDVAAEPTSMQVLLADGRVADFPPHLPPCGLPVLVGCGLEPIPGLQEWQLTGPGAGGVLELMAAISASGLETVRPVDFILADKDGYTIQLGEAGGRLLLGRREFAARLQLYMATRDRLVGESVVDLRFRGRIGILARA